jgi:hypothetical protein
MEIQIPALLEGRSRPVHAQTERGLSFEDLMGLHDEEFVQAAYPIIMGRRADPAGLKYYSCRLRGGFSRFSVIDQLCRSPDARQDWVTNPGLKLAVNRYRKSRKLAGWRLALKDPELGRAPRHRRARVLQNSFGAQQQTILKALSGISAQNRALERVMLDLVELLESGGSPFPLKGQTERQPPKAKKKLTPRLPNSSLGDVREVDLPAEYKALLSVLRF